MKFNYRDITNLVERPSISQTEIGLYTQDKEWVSALGLREYQMQFGSAQLKMGRGSVGAPRRKRIVTRDTRGVSWTTPRSS